jgi:hypothetical protein
MNTAAENAAKLSVPVAPPNVPHARLMNLISALSTGLSAAGTSLATHGREGGEPQVAAEQRAAQESKIQAQQAQQAQRNSQIQGQIAIFDTNAKLMNSYQMLGTMHNAMTKSDLEVSGEQQRQAGEQQTQAIQGAEFSKQNWGLTPDQVSGKSPLTPQNVSPSQSMLNRAVGSDQIGALAILGKDNPAVIEAQRVAKSPSPTAQEISAAGQGLVVAQQQLAATTDAKTKQQAAAETAPLPEQTGCDWSPANTDEAEGSARPQRARPLYLSIWGLLHIMCAHWMQRRSCEPDTSACTELWRGTAC